MNVTCPSCGAEMDMDVLLAHEDSRHALARLAVVSLPLGKQVLQYLRLFKPATRQMSHSRSVALMLELLPDLERRMVERNGRQWPAPLDAWRTAIERMLELRDNGKLALPLKGHGYLYEVIAGLADKVEGAAERATEADRRERRTAGVGPELQPAAATFAAPVVIEKPSGPSRHALRLRAQIEAEKLQRMAAREPAAGGFVDCGECPHVTTGCADKCMKAPA